MKNEKITITIGIPAYNEEKNICSLLDVLIDQKINTGTIEKIIVVSDGSIDKTVDIVKSYDGHLIRIIDRKKRLGVNETLNEIFSLVKSDILVIVNADVLPIGHNFIERLIAPLIKDAQVGLVGGDYIAARPKLLFEKIILNSYKLKIHIGKQINDGRNVYMCYGGNRAFSKTFYSELRFPNKYPDDSFSYFECLRRGFKFVFEEKAKVKLRAPGTFQDHANQSIRFIAGKRKLEEHFGKFIIDEGYFIPKKIYTKVILKFLFKDPFYTISYLLITFLLRNSSKKAEFNTKWEIVKSTKNLS